MKASEIGKMHVSINIETDKKDSVGNVDLGELTAISEQTLSEEMMRIPSSIAFYSVLAVKSSHREQRAKMSLEICEAQLDSEFRKNGEADKKLTETAIKNKVRLDERFQEAQNAWLNALEEFQLLQKIVIVLDKKAQMLQSLNADRRMERQAYNNAGGDTGRDGE